MICRCGVEISGSSKFCPHCGQSVDEVLYEAATGILQAQGAAAAVTKRELVRPTGLPVQGATTIAANPSSPPLPIKFRELLKAGTKPEVIIWDLFRHKTVLWNHLESLTRDVASKDSSAPLRSAIAYLQSHCMACGDRAKHFEQGTTPLCDECQKP